MKRKLAVQLYSMRAEVAKDGMDSVLRTVAEIGFLAVEPAGFGDLSITEFVAACKKYDLEICSAHGAPLKGDSIQEAVDFAGALGLKSLCCGYGPNDFKDIDAIKATAYNTFTILQKLASAGLGLYQHNHYWEFDILNGRLKYDLYVEYCPQILFQLDAFWSANFGANDAVAMARHYAGRIVSLHVKDGVFPPVPADRKVDLRPLGEGQLDIPGICAVVPDSVGHIIVELDSAPIDMTEAIRRSYTYLVNAGLGLGRS